MPTKPVKTGVVVGGGPPPGYQWNALILDVAFEEAMRFLNVDQYHHQAAQVRELALQADPTHSDVIDVRPVEDFHEIRDKGGILGGLNVRVFFFVHKPQRSIVVLGAMRKQNDGPTPKGTKVKISRRMRNYVRGAFTGTGRA
jgi:phage-related protein